MANTPTSVSGITISKMYAASYDFVAGAADAAIANEVFSGFEGFLAGVAVKFGTTAPTSGTVFDVTDADGIVIATGALTASGRLTIDKPIPFIGNLTVSSTGNAVNSATGKVRLFFV